MRTRILAVLVAAVAVHSAGCFPCCRRCCGGRGDPDRIPPPAVDRLPPPAPPNVSGAPPVSGPKPVGAYGGSGQ